MKKITKALSLKKEQEEMTDEEISELKTGQGYGSNI